MKYYFQSPSFTVWETFHKCDWLCLAFSMLSGNLTRIKAHFKCRNRLKEFHHFSNMTRYVYCRLFRKGIKSFSIGISLWEKTSAGSTVYVPSKPYISKPDTTGVLTAFALFMVHSHVSLFWPVTLSYLSSASVQRVQ